MAHLFADGCGSDASRGDGCKVILNQWFTCSEPFRHRAAFCSCPFLWNVARVWMVNSLNTREKQESTKRCYHLFISESQGRKSAIRVQACRVAGQNEQSSTGNAISIPREREQAAAAEPMEAACCTFVAQDLTLA